MDNDPEGSLNQFNDLLKEADSQMTKKVGAGVDLGKTTVSGMIKSVKTVRKTHITAYTN